LFFIVIRKRLEKIRRILKTRGFKNDLEEIINKMVIGGEFKKFFLKLFIQAKTRVFYTIIMNK
jgi:hypothetical protein